MCLTVQSLEPFAVHRERARGGRTPEQSSARVQLGPGKQGQNPKWQITSGTGSSENCGASSPVSLRGKIPVLPAHTKADQDSDALFLPDRERDRRPQGVRSAQEGWKPPPQTLRLL